MLLHFGDLVFDSESFRVQILGGDVSIKAISKPAADPIVETMINGVAIGSYVVGVRGAAPTGSPQSLVTNRWADGANADGASGVVSDMASTSGKRQVINNNAAVLPGARSTFGGRMAASNG